MENFHANPLLKLFPQYRQRRSLVAADMLFQPHHVIPPSEFIAALVEFAHHAIPQFFMETNAVLCEVGLIFPYGTGNADVHVEEMTPL